MAIEETPTGAAALMLRTAYLAQRPNIFPSEGALDWFIREHRNALITAGAISLIRQRWLINPAAFDAHVLSVGAIAAAKKLPASSPHMQHAGQEFASL